MTTDWIIEKWNFIGEILTTCLPWFCVTLYIQCYASRCSQYFVELFWRNSPSWFAATAVAIPCPSRSSQLSEKKLNKIWQTIGWETLYNGRSPPWNALEEPLGSTLGHLFPNLRGYALHIVIHHLSCHAAIMFYGSRNRPRRRRRRVSVQCAWIWILHRALLLALVGSGKVAWKRHGVPLKYTSSLHYPSLPARKLCLLTLSIYKRVTSSSSLTCRAFICAYAANHTWQVPCCRSLASHRCNVSADTPAIIN